MSSDLHCTFLQGDHSTVGKRRICNNQLMCGSVDYDLTLLKVEG